MSVRLSFGSRAGVPTLQQSANKHQHHHAKQHAFKRGPFASIDDLTASLRLEIEASQRSALPNCTAVELHLSLDCLLPLHRPTIGPYAEGGESDLPHDFKSTTARNDGSVISDPFPEANASAVINVAGSRERQIVQRAASRGIIAALERTDRYRYSFNNAWTAKDEEGSRFSYICQDSVQNKDRHANGYTRTLKHLKSDGERGPRKPTYDCKGSISVKFSTTKQSVDVYYRHYAIHATAADKKVLPRAVPRAHTSTSEGTPTDMGGLAAALQAEGMHSGHQDEQHTSSAHYTAVQSTPADSPLASRTEATNVARPLKRKHDGNPPPAVRTPRDSDGPESLMELLRRSETAIAPVLEVEKAREIRNGVLPPVSYELPSWQTPPVPLRMSHREHDAPNQPPYNPQQTPGRAPVQPMPELASPQKNWQSLASESRGKGLFTTNKPVKDWVVQTADPAQKHVLHPHPSYNNMNKPSRARTSCTNCRSAKRKCDKQRPQCEACVRGGRSGCTFEGTRKSSEITVSQQPSQNSSSWGSLSQSSGRLQAPGWQNMPSTPHFPRHGAEVSVSSMGWPNTGFTSSVSGMARDGSTNPWFAQR